MLGSDAGIVEAGGNRMRLDDLAVAIHQQISAVAVQHAGLTAGDRSRMLAARQAVTGGFDAVDVDRRVVEERVEQAHGV